MKKEIPILFSTPMVQAILEGRKTQTRRVVKNQPDYRGFRTTNVPFEDWHGRELRCPHGKPGDLLWVRETWAPVEHPELKYRFMADHKNPKSVSWKPSIHMPKEAARIWLEVTEIRVERLRDISEKDVSAEGVQYRVVNADKPGFVKPVFSTGENSAIDFMPKGEEMTEANLLYAHWAELWCGINGRESWDANPWVWVIQFKVISKTGKP